MEWNGTERNGTNGWMDGWMDGEGVSHCMSRSFFPCSTCIHHHSGHFNEFPIPAPGPYL